MSEESLGSKSRQALVHIRSLVMKLGRFPSVRELMESMEYKSPRSATLLLLELERNGFLEKRDDGTYTLIKDLEVNNNTRTVSIPLVGNVACGARLLAAENIEAMIPVSVSLAKPGSVYFLLKAKGDSMNEAGITDGDLVLIKQQSTAENGQQVVALIDDEATVKEFQRVGNVIKLVPRSSNPKHQPIIMTSDFRIQGIVVEAIPDNS